MRLNKGLWLLVVTLAVLAGALAPPVQAEGPRWVARIDEPFEVGGQIFPPGELSLRQVLTYSPVATLNEVRVDGRSLGFVLARCEASAAPAIRNELIFQRSESGHLVLAFVALRGQEVRQVYHLGEGEHAGTWQAAAQSRPLWLASAR
jgi:hypothetical protein